MFQSPLLTPCRTIPSPFCPVSRKKGIFPHAFPAVLPLHQLCHFPLTPSDNAGVFSRRWPDIYFPRGGPNPILNLVSGFATPQRKSKGFSFSHTLPPVRPAAFLCTPMFSKHVYVFFSVVVFRICPNNRVHRDESVPLVERAFPSRAEPLRPVLYSSVFLKVFLKGVDVPTSTFPLSGTISY